MLPPKEKPTDPEAPIMDPFPQPKTFPSGWDLSGMIVDTQKESFEVPAKSTQAGNPSSGQ